jgi:hypothetical protein
VALAVVRETVASDGERLDVASGRQLPDHGAVLAREAPVDVWREPCRLVLPPEVTQEVEGRVADLVLAQDLVQPLVVEAEPRARNGDGLDVPGCLQLVRRALIARRREKPGGDRNPAAKYAFEIWYQAASACSLSSIALNLCLRVG